MQENPREVVSGAALWLLCIIKYWYCLNRPKKNFICGMANERVQTLGVLTLQTTNMKCWHHISSGVNASSRLGGGDEPCEPTVRLPD